MSSTDRGVSPSTDRRLARRRPTRLRDGRLFDTNGKFLADCGVRDRTPLGAALAVPAATCLPATVGFYDEEQRTLHAARIVWTKDAACGLIFLSPPHHDRRVRGGFGGAFHALGAPERLARTVLG